MISPTSEPHESKKINLNQLVSQAIPSVLWYHYTTVVTVTTMFVVDFEAYSTGWNPFWYCGTYYYYLNKLT